MELEKKIAKAILRAAQIREESFDKASFNKAIEEAIDSYQERRKISLHALYPGIDASTFYKKDLATSCQEAAIEVGLPASLSYLLSLSFHDWNNMEGWARGISASELNGSWGGEIEDLPDLRSTLPDLCSVGDWKRARAKNLKDGYWGCACGSRKFNLLQSQENVKTICSKDRKSVV